MRTIYSEDQIADRIKEMAAALYQDLGKDFVMVPILNGGFIFAADLVRALYKAGADPEIDFLQLSSYGAGRESSGEIKMVKDVTSSVQGQTVVIVDDVLDSGRSVAFATQLFQERGASKVVTCVAVDKTTITGRDISADYSLFDLQENAYLVGYGMDDAGGQRGLPVIGALDD